MQGNDRSLWARYAKGVKQLKRGKRDRPDGRETEKSPEAPSAAKAAAIVRQRETKTLSAPPRLDAQTERKLRRGDIALEARLDLHGMTQREAHDALIRFVERQSARGKRRLLVITGKGSPPTSFGLRRDKAQDRAEALAEAGKGRSPLRANLPRWCGVPPLAENILALRPAAPKHGGDGAWYVILRRARTRE